MKNLLILLTVFCYSLSGNSQMILDGSATGDCDCYDITTTTSQAGSIWSPSTIDLTLPFDLNFVVNLGSLDGSGADGMVFALRKTGTFSGGVGSLLGYGGIDNSIGVEIDTWQSGAEVADGEIADDHIGLHSNGVVDHNLVSAISIGNIEDGRDHDFRVTWDPGTNELVVYLDGTLIFTYTDDLVASIFGGDPDVYFGWTGATGGSWNLQTVCMIRDIEVNLDPVHPCAGVPIDFNNSSSGSITIDGVPYTDYFWEFDDGFTSTDENVSRTYPTNGSYSFDLTVTDFTGCSYTETIDFEVADLDPFMDGSGVSCFGGNDGIAYAFIPGGDDYTYLWDDEDAQTTWTAVDLSAGTYTVIVEDEFGCSGTGEITIEEEDEIIFEELTVIDASCNENDGSIRIRVSGGDSPYSYSINGGGTFSGVTFYEDLAGGEYEIVIVDDNDCEIRRTVEVNSSGLTSELIFNTPTCHGFSDGSIIVDIEATEVDLIFIITDADGTVLNIDNSNAANSLKGGWYYYTVDDGTDCIIEDSIFLTQPEELDVDLTVVNPLCYGDKTGYAVAEEVYNATGDPDLITYNWSPIGLSGLGVDSAWALGAGEHILTINDENGCDKSFTFEVKQPDSLNFVELAADPAYCRLYNYQNGNGVVKAAVAGGVPDFDYTWTNLETGEGVGNSTWGGLNPGRYQIVATDNNGCTITEIITVDSLNPRANFEITSDQFTSNYEGTANIDAHFVNLSENFANPNNPLADTTFFWNFDFDNITHVISHDLFETFDTTYEVRGQSYDIEVCLTAFNKNGCSNTLCKTINVYEPISLENVNVFTPNGDGINDLFTFKNHATSISEFNCVIVDRWGVIKTELNDISESWDGTDMNGSICTNGVYFYKYNAVSNNGTEINGQGNVTIIDIK